MKYRQFQAMTYEEGLVWVHKGACGESVYPTLQIKDTTIWECIVHGFINSHAVMRRRA